MVPARVGWELQLRSNVTSLGIYSISASIYARVSHFSPYKKVNTIKILAPPPPTGPGGRRVAQQAKGQPYSCMVGCARRFRPGFVLGLSMVSSVGLRPRAPTDRRTRADACTPPPSKSTTSTSFHLDDLIASTVFAKYCSLYIPFESTTLFSPSPSAFGFAWVKDHPHIFLCVRQVCERARHAFVLSMCRFVLLKTYTWALPMLAITLIKLCSCGTWSYRQGRSRSRCPCCSRYMEPTIQGRR